MATILISDVAETVFFRLHELAKSHGRTPEAEAKAILEEQLHAAPVASVWDQVNAFRDRLAASNRPFSDSAELLRDCGDFRAIGRDIDAGNLPASPRAGDRPGQ